MPHYPACSRTRGLHSYQPYCQPLDFSMSSDLCSVRKALNERTSQDRHWQILPSEKVNSVMRTTKQLRILPHQNNFRRLENSSPLEMFLKLPPEVEAWSQVLPRRLSYSIVSVSVSPSPSVGNQTQLVAPVQEGPSVIPTELVVNRKMRDCGWRKRFVGSVAESHRGKTGDP